MSSTTNRHLPNNLLRAFTFFALLGFSYGLFKSFHPDSFAENVLQPLTNFDVAAIGQSVVPLTDGSFVIAGILKYPAGISTHSNFTDEPDIQRYDNSTARLRYAGMVLRVMNDGTVAWAKRTGLCHFDDTFTTVYDGQYIYVAGSTIGIPRGIGTPDCCTDTAGMLLLKYNIDGTQESIIVHGDRDERYISVALNTADPDSLFLVSCTPGRIGPYREQLSKSPEDNGLTLSRVRKRDMALVQQQIISDNTTVEATLVKDDFWDMAISHDGNVIYVTALRSARQGFVTSRTPTVFALSGNNLMTAHTRSLPNELQVDIRLATTNATRGVFVSYIDRTANKEFVVVWHMGTNLTDAPWGNGAESVFRYRILLDTEFVREVIKSTVKDIDVDGQNVTRLLVYSAEVVNRSLTPPSISPPPSFERHRQLGNGRPALIVVSPYHEISHIVQVQTEQRWEPFRMIVGDTEHVIVGADRGLIHEGISKVLVTGVRRQALASPNPSPSPSPPAVQSPRVSPNGTPSTTPNIDCLGESTQLSGRSIGDIVREDRRLRLQIHPGRWGKRVEVLCHAWNNGTSDMLCATGDHVIKHWGKAIYMKDFCEEVDCVKRVEGVLNFKGGCRDELIAHEVLSVTMHAGGGSAKEAVKTECGMMTGVWRLWWWLTTL